MTRCNEPGSVVPPALKHFNGEAIWRLGEPRWSPQETSPTCAVPLTATDPNKAVLAEAVCRSCAFCTSWAYYLLTLWNRDLVSPATLLHSTALLCPVRGSHPWQSLKPVGPDVEIFFAGCWTWCHVSWCGPGTSDEYAGGLFLYALPFHLLRKQKSGGSLVTAPSPDWVNLLPDSWNLMLSLMLPCWLLAHRGC